MKIAIMNQIKIYIILIVLTCSLSCKDDDIIDFVEQPIYEKNENVNILLIKWLKQKA